MPSVTGDLHGNSNSRQEKINNINMVDFIFHFLPTRGNISALTGSSGVVAEQHVELCVTQGCDLSAGWPIIYFESDTAGV